jgi:hypothetical protein
MGRFLITNSLRFRSAFIAIIAFVLLFFETTRQCYNIIKGPDSLAYCDITPPNDSAFTPDKIAITGVTIHSSEVTLTFSDGKWSLPQKNDSGRRAIQSFKISIAESLPTNMLQDWIISLRGPYFSKKISANLRKEGNVYSLSTAAPFASRVFPKHKNTVTWIGDTSVITLSLQRASQLVLRLLFYVSLFSICWNLAHNRTSVPNIHQDHHFLTDDYNQQINQKYYLRFFSILLTVILLVAPFYYLGSSSWPGLHWDASAYAPAILNAANNIGWQPGIYPVGENGQYSLKYEGHGFFSILIFGYLIPCQDWNMLLRTLGLFNGLAAALWFLIGKQYLQSTKSIFSIDAFLLGILAGVVSVNLQGRPEYPAVILSSLPLLIRIFTHNQAAQVLSIAGCCGLLFTCSPQAGALSALGAAIFYGLSGDYNFRIYGAKLAITGAVAFSISFLLVYFFCPFTFIDWIRIMFMSGQRALDFRDHLFRLDIYNQMGISTISPFWNIFTFAIVGLVVSSLIALNRWIALAFFSILSLYLWPKLTDYGLIYSFPMAICFVYNFYVAPKSKEKKLSYILLTAGLRVFLFSYTLALLQFFAESYTVSFYEQNLSLSSEKSKQIVTKEIGSLHDTGVVGFCWYPSCTLATLGDASSAFVALPINFEDSEWYPSSSGFLRRHPAAVKLLIVPAEIGKFHDVLKISDTTYRRVFLCSETIPSIPFSLKSRAIGYNFAIYRKSDEPNETKAK